MASKKKKVGKRGGGAKDDDWNDDVDEKKLPINGTDEIDEDETSDVNQRSTKSVPKAKSMAAAFNLLSTLDNDDVDSGSESNKSDDDQKSAKKQTKSAKISKNKSSELDAMANEIEKLTIERVPKKSSKKPSKKGTKEDDELDAILAQLDQPKASVAAKGKKSQIIASTTVAKCEENIDQPQVFHKADTLPIPTTNSDKPPMDLNTIVPPTINSDKPSMDPNATVPPPIAESREKSLSSSFSDKPIETMGDTEETEAINDADDGDDIEKKKRKRKEKEKEKEKKKKEKEKKGGASGTEKDGGKKKKHVDLIKELLRKKQEAEEEAIRKLKEEEERLEALRLQREAEEQLIREKKEREKQKKKERDAKLKAEGKYLTPAQKEKLRRQQANLANFADAVVPALQSDVPTKRPIYDNKKRKQQLKAKTEEDASTVRSSISTEQPVIEPTTDIDILTVKPASEDIKEDTVVDDWDAIVSDHDDEPEITVCNPEVATRAVESDVQLEPKQIQTEINEVNDKADAEQSSTEDESTSEEESESDEENEDESRPGKETKEQIRERVRARIKKRREDAESKRTTDNLRAPVICVLGHVDTGKTKMLDTIRRTSVQESEAGGITQQIGATQVPAAAIIERCRMVRNLTAESLKIPGFLIIDTPGHESFANLRSRGSSLCDIAILVVDIMHGLEPQTLESLKLLLKRQTPFVIALNKIDRLYNWESSPRKDIWQLIKSQPTNVQLEFKERFEKIKTEFAEQGINIALANVNPDEKEYVSVVPTSAFVGDGIGNLMAHIALFSQTTLASRLAFSEDLDCYVMEVKSLPGLGTTIDVILVNGTLRVGDIIILTGTDGAIMTQIRELLKPQPLKELRVKNAYDHFPMLKGAEGIKVCAKGLEKALAGLPLFVAHREDEVDVLRQDAQEQLSRALHAIKLSTEGVYVQSSTLGSLEALLEFLRSQKIPYCGVNIGPVHKKDVMKASTMLEHKTEFAVILAFDVKIERDAQQYADSEGVRIFHADIIYHLQDAFLKYREELREKRRRENEHLAIFPFKLRILPQNIFNARNPIVIGVSVEAGQLKIGSPVCVPSKDCIVLGNVSSIERNHENIKLAKTGDEVAIKIENTTGDAPKMYGRHFTHEDILVSRITRETIDVCKTYFREDLSKSDWHLVVELKKMLNIF